MVIWWPGRNEISFDEAMSEGLHDRHVVATWNLQTVTAFEWRQRKSQRVSD